MALRTPPSWLQNGSHPADNDRLTTQALYATTGIIGSTSLAVTAQGSPNMTVNVAAGWCAIAGSSANSGVYVAYNDATTVLTITTANPSLPRIDRIVVAVEDAYYSGATNTVVFTVIAGTPAASPAAPATPSNSISLATIAVAAAAASISAGNITDTRVGVTSNAFLPLTGGTVSGATTFSGSTAFSGLVTASNTITSTSSITAASFIGSAGTTTVAPLKLTSGTNLTTPQAGAFEYDGAVGYFTPEATSAKRGLLGADYYYMLGTNNSLASSTATQSLFGVGLTLPTGRYEYELLVFLSTGSVNHNTQFSIGGTATKGGGWISFALQSTTTNQPTSIYSFTPGTPVSLFSSGGTTTSTFFVIKGNEIITSAGTWIPQVTFTVAPGGSNNTGVGSFVRVRRVGIVSGSNTISIGAWA